MIKHGTSRGYTKHGCRCAPCREAEVARQRKWRRRLKAGKVEHRDGIECAVPVLIRGELYPSIAAAAAAHKVMPSTIHSHLNRHGHADFVGLGTRSPGHNSKAHRVTPVTIHGRRFESIQSASDYLGFSYSWTYKAIAYRRPADASDRMLAALMQADARRAA